MLKTLLIFLLSTSFLFSYDLYVHEAGNVDRASGVVSTGFPFAMGEVIDVSNLVVTSGGNPIEAQFKSLSDYPDGSARWVLVSFVTPIDAGEIKVFDVTTGANPASGSLVTEDGSKITVNTGNMEFEVLKGASFNGINKVSVGGTVVAQAVSGETVLFLRWTMEQLSLVY